MFKSLLLSIIAFSVIVSAQSIPDDGFIMQNSNGDTFFGLNGGTPYFGLNNQTGDFPNVAFYGSNIIATSGNTNYFGGGTSQFKANNLTFNMRDFLTLNVPGDITINTNKTVTSTGITKGFITGTTIELKTLITSAVQSSTGDISIFPASRAEGNIQLFTGEKGTIFINKEPGFTGSCTGGVKVNKGLITGCL